MTWLFYIQLYPKLSMQTWTFGGWKILEALSEPLPTHSQQANQHC